MGLTDLSAVELVLVAASLFFALLVRGMSGFGATLIATPLLAFLVPLHVAVSVISGLMWVSFGMLAFRDRRHILWREIRYLLLPTLVGVAAGLYL